jgi:asparaginyl-tRNA synthetase
LVKSPAKGQAIEMLIDDAENHLVEILGENGDPKNYPLAGKFHSMEHLRTILHLRPRTNIISSMARLRNSLSFATHSYFQELGFLYVHTPLITTSDCEGAGEMFQVSTIMKEDTKDIPCSEDPTKPTEVDFKKDFFDKPSYLTVSGQLAVENYSVALNNVYTFGPTFRAENSNTSRHLAEFWMIEPEMCFAGIDELFALTEGYVKYCIEYCLTNIRPDIEFFNQAFKRKQKQKQKESKGKKGKGKTAAKEKNFDDLVQYLEDIVSKPFQKLEYTEAVKILVEAVESKKKKFEEKPYWGLDLSSEHERYLCEEVFDGPLFLYNYPADIKPFYMRLNDDKKTVQNMDLMLPFIGELVGGSVREERHDVLLELMKKNDMNVKDYEYYLDLRKYGTSPHCGFGLGFERLVMLVSGLDNIRDAIPFPRFPGNCNC